jgi:hypothetical protein
MPTDKGPLRSDKAMKSIDDQRRSNAVISEGWGEYRWQKRMKAA